MAAVVVGVSGWAVAVGAGPAGAVVGGTVEVPIDGNFHFQGTGTVANTLVVTKSGTTITLDDVHSVDIVDGPCTYPVPADDTYVSCTVAPASPDVTIEPGGGSDKVTLTGGGSVHWLVSLGDGSDTADLTGVDTSGTWVNGDDGNDTMRPSPFGEHLEGDGGTDTVSYAGRAAGVVVDLQAEDGGTGAEHDTLTTFEKAVGGTGADTLSGGAGADTLEGGPNADVLSGRGGKDILVGGSGTDQLHGGADADLASYRGHASGVSASLNGLADDGGRGEGDLVAADVEGLAGSVYADVLTGNSGANALHGDAFTGLALPQLGGADTITTNGGGDGVWGGGGDDTIVGSSGHDVVHGGDGQDTVHGGAHEDALYGDQGDDELYGGDAFDALDGGPGTDLCDGGPIGATTVACEP